MDFLLALPSPAADDQDAGPDWARDCCTGLGLRLHTKEKVLGPHCLGTPENLSATERVKFYSFHCDSFKFIVRQQPGTKGSFLDSEDIEHFLSHRRFSWTVLLRGLIVRHLSAWPRSLSKSPAFLAF